MRFLAEWHSGCQSCGRWACSCVVAGSVVAAGWGYATCKGDRCDAGELGRIPMPQFTVTSTSTAGPSDAVTVYNNVTDEEVEFAVLNAKTFQQYDIEASASATTMPRLTNKST